MAPLCLKITTCKTFRGEDPEVRLGHCFTPYQRLWLYNGAPLVAFYDTLGIRRKYSRLKTPGVLTGERIPRPPSMVDIEV